MWHSPAWVDGRGHLSSGRWLLIGNSRWHWAVGRPGELQSWSDAPGAGDPEGITGWAAVGPITPQLALPARCRVLTSQVPLGRTPPWLGVDRALGGWGAWQLSGGAVLVADAGTALSLTRIHADGGFAGGRLLAGAALQLRSLQAATAGLPALELPLATPGNPWPNATGEAMAVGVLRGLAAAVAQAGREALVEDPGCRLWITGGDGLLLAPLVQELLEGSSLEVQLAPALALEALAALRPGPGR